MTDKQLISTLWNIRSYCQRTVCRNCIFKRDIINECNLKRLSINLIGAPMDWDMEEIIKIIREEEE